MAYNNSHTIPYGMDGKVWSLCYNYIRENRIKKRFFKYSARFDNGGLKNNYVYNGDLVLIKYLKFDTKGNWFWTLNDLTRRFSVFGGFGTCFNAEVTYPTVESEVLIGSASIFGNWSISTTINNRISYRFSKLIIENTIEIPFLTSGFYTEYQYNPSVLEDDLYSYYFKPNTISSIWNYLVIENQLKISYPVGKMQMSLSYFYTYSKYEINNNMQLYDQNILSFGIHF